MLADTERKFGADSEPVLNDLVILTGYLMTVSRYTDAEPVGRRAVALAEKLGDQNELPTALHALGYVLASEGRITDAEPLFRRALAIEQAHTPPDTATILTDQRALGTILADGGRYAEAEPLLRALVAADRAAAKPDRFEEAQDLSDLAHAIAGQGRFAEATPLYREEVALAEQNDGKDSPYLAPDLTDLAEVLLDQDQPQEAGALLQRAVDLTRKGFGAEAPQTGTSERHLAEFQATQGRDDEAEAGLNLALGIDEKAFGETDPRLLPDLNDLALLYAAQSRSVEAEALQRRSLAIDEATQGADSTATAQDLDDLAFGLVFQGRLDEATPLYQRALAIEQKDRAADDPAVVAVLVHLGETQRMQGGYAQAEKTLRQAVAANAAEGANAGASFAAQRDLAQTLVDEVRYAEAETLLRAALAGDTAPGRSDATLEISQDLTGLASALEAEGKFAEAEAVTRQRLDIDKTLSQAARYTPYDRVQIGRLEADQGRWDVAVGDLRAGCAATTASARALASDPVAAAGERETARACSQVLAEALFGWSSNGGGAADPDRPTALLAQAFTAAQQSTASSAGDALAQASAEALAGRAGVGAEAHAYETALAELADLNQRFSAAAGAGQVQTEQALAAARATTQAKIAQLKDTLATKAPAYWDYRSPDPVSVDELEAATGDAGKLLHPNEALVFWVTSTGDTPAFVFAVSKDGMAVAATPISSEAIRSKVEDLRWRIDPNSFSRSGADAQISRTESAHEEPFDRTVAHDLYVALLGDPQIQRVIGAPNIDTLLIVPTGPLTSLPPGLLVVEAPKGSDSDPAALAATHWLIRDKAISVIPTVASLRTLRLVVPASRGTADVKLLALADPDFAGAGSVPQPPKDATPPPVHAPLPPARSLERDGRGTADARALPPLYGTLAEGKAIADIVDPGDASALLLGPDATKTALLQRDADGRLKRARVIAFSTHGLLTGDFTGLTEPALALAAPPKTGADPSDDGLLKASDAAALTLNADWVILSACNTASGDGKGAEGLSGLARAFFHAGAASLLVSHWRVDDNATAQLVTDTLRFQQDGRSKARALQAAMLKMLNDPKRVEPRYWAPFVVVGEAN